MNGHTVRGIFEGDSIPDIFIPQMTELYKQSHCPFDWMIPFYSLDQINKAAEDSEKGMFESYFCVLKFKASGM